MPREDVAAVVMYDRRRSGWSDDGEPKPGFNVRTNQFGGLHTQILHARKKKLGANLIVKDHGCCSFGWKKRQP
jgi:hypothetical protein